ncbi:MAG TPA: polyprenol monophosphomannose synthase [Chthoniobacterales bacterium]
MEIAIIVPTLNEVENVQALITRIEQTGLAFREIIFVDDGSTDGTRAQLRSLAANHRVRLVERDGCERGLAGAILAGAESASAELLAIMDADLSHPPQELPALLGPILAGEADLVIGSRYVAGGATPGWPIWRRVISRVASGLAYPLTGVSDSMCGFFAIRRDSLLRFAKTAVGFKIVFETIIRGRKMLRVREVPIVFRDRECGRSKMSLREVFRFGLRWLRAIARRFFDRSPTALPAHKLSHH